jgi:hypothetical protein
MTIPAWTRSWKLRSLQLPISARWSSEVFFPALFINDYFNLWLKNFLKRQLTVTSDILLAFDGALSASTRHIGKFHHGLPVDYFCESLHWLVGTDSMYMGGGKKPHQGLTQRRQGFPSWSWTGWIWDVAPHEEFHTNYQGKTPAFWCRVGIWSLKFSANYVLEFWQISSPDVEGWKLLDHFPISAFENEAPRHVQMDPIAPDFIVIKTVTANLYLSSQKQSEWTAALNTYSSLDFIPENLVGGLNFPQGWQDDKIGQPLQVIVTGSYFYGPSHKSPDQTDEMNPMIDMLVVQKFEDGTMERLTSFVTRYDSVKKLEWTSVVAIVR